MSDKRIWLSPPHMCGEEVKFIQEAFDTNWIAPVGPNLDAFELELAAYLDPSVHVAAVSSGTAAIHLALAILGVGPGDEVICPTFTFIATCNPIRYQGASPVLVDSEKDTWNMDPGLMKHAIQDRIKQTGKKPKAIIVVHLYGMPARMNELLSIAREFEIPLIEDAADAMGAEYFSKKCGTLGDIGILSFNGNKIITTSGGGALISQNEDHVKKARYLASQARDSIRPYLHQQIGYNYRLSNISAGIGRGQLTVIKERINQRRTIYDFYKSALSQHPLFTFLPAPAGHVSNRWLSTVLVNSDELEIANRETLILKLEENNIESRPFWKPMHLQPVFNDSVSYLNGLGERLFNKGLCLPSGSGMTNEQLKEIVEIISRA